MNYKNKTESYNFWLDRIKKKKPNQVCTNDVALDALETKQILSKLTNNANILEIGCGNGLMYKEIRKKFNINKYIGTDFVQELIDICNNEKSNSKDIFLKYDMTEINKNSFKDKFDFIISKRAVQNVLDSNLQINTIDTLGHFLKPDGLMILVESSSKAQKFINKERLKYNLDSIKPPFHNMFLDDDIIKKYDFKNVKILDINPFSSDFYFITRIIYARLANEYLKEKPNYDHPLQKIAISMSENLSTVDYAQIKTFIFKKKK